MSSESHGKVERQIRTFRFALDRVAGQGAEYDDSVGKWNMEDWRIICGTLENGMRSEITQGANAGYSSSERATGRSCTMHRNMLSDTLVTAQAAGQPSVSKLQGLQDRAMQAYQSVTNDRRLRQMLTQKVRVGRCWKDYELGDLVWVLREQHKGRGSKWIGPGTVSGVT